jgi:O-methyltransferase
MQRDSYTQDHIPSRAIRFMGYPIISDQIDNRELAIVWEELEGVLKKNITGAIAEFGCYIGTTSLFIRRMLDKHGQSINRTFHVYDSFEGLPEKQRADESSVGVDFTVGKLYASKKELLRQFQSAALQPPVVHKGWFNQLTVSEIPERIAFAFLDGDFYDSIYSSLSLAWPRMQRGSTLLIDDYQRVALPGVTKALHEFLKDKHSYKIRHKANIAIVEL